MCAYFYFHCCGCHLHLHSFPTRRSSDLVAREMSGASVAPTIEPVAKITAEFAPVSACAAANSAVIFATGSIVGDRKSTRLNSSHMSISYAVFCLKKKNNQLAAVPSDHTP